MRYANAVFFAAILCTPCVFCAAQAPTTPTPAHPASPASPAPPAPGRPSGVLQPSLDTVQQTVTVLKLDKWKKGTVRDEAGDHIRAILKDIQVTLPSLLAEADAAPATISKQLPVTRNVGALYDVLLRVLDASRVSAPTDQVSQLEQALLALSNARHAFDDRLQGTADSLEKQVSDLQGTVKAQAAKLLVPPAPVVVPCPPPPPVKKPRKKPVTPAKPPQTAPSPAATPAPAPKS
jgi:hypothetical protein